MLNRILLFHSFSCLQESRRFVPLDGEALISFQIQIITPVFIKYGGVIILSSLDKAKTVFSLNLL